MTEPKKTMNWGAPAVETRSDGIASATHINTTALLPNEVDFNWDLVDFLSSSQEFVPAPSPPSPSLPHVNDFKQRQKEELDKFLQQQREAEQAFLLEQKQREEEEARRKRQTEEAAEKIQSLGENSESQTVTVLLDILAELRSLKQMYQTSLLRPKRKRPSRAKQSSPVTTPVIPPLVISTKSLTGVNPEVGLGRGKGLRQLKRIDSRS